MTKKINECAYLCEGRCLLLTGTCSIRSQEKLWHNCNFNAWYTKILKTVNAGEMIIGRPLKQLVRQSRPDFLKIVEYKVLTYILWLRGGLLLLRSDKPRQYGSMSLVQKFV
jgi:hypothetical protein